MALLRSIVYELVVCVVRLDDAELQEACFRVYNDWLAEFCRYDLKRLPVSH